MSEQVTGGLVERRGLSDYAGFRAVLKALAAAVLAAAAGDGRAAGTLEALLAA